MKKIMMSLVLLSSLVLCTVANAKTIHFILDNNMQKHRLTVTEDSASKGLVSRLSGGTVSVDVYGHTVWDIDVPDESNYEYSLRFMTQTESEEPSLAYTFHVTPSKLSVSRSGYSQLFEFRSHRRDGEITIQMIDAPEQSVLFLISIGVLTSIPFLFI